VPYIQGHQKEVGIAMKFAPVEVDMPFIYWFIALSTIMWGIASTVAYWKGWWQ
jgi:hypothetical protein